MQISIEHYLSVIRQTVRDTLIPELKSADALRAGEIVLRSVEELIKQETTTPILLQRALPAGIAIARRLIGAVGAVGMAVDGLQRRLDDIKVDPNRPDAHRLRSAYAALNDVVQGATLPYLKQLMVNPKSPCGPILAGLAEFARWDRDTLLEQMEPLSLATPEQQKPGELTAEKLHAFLKLRLPSDPSFAIAHFERLAGGMSSKRLYAFTLTYESGSALELVARHAPMEPLIDIGCFDLPREYALVETLFAAGYPLPEPLWLGRDIPGISGSFYVMRRVPGIGSGGLFSNHAIPASALLDMAEQLAVLHSLPLSKLRKFIDEYEEPSLYSCSAAEGTRRSLARMISEWSAAPRQAAPSEIYVFAWALANIPKAEEGASLLHGDFTPHNCLFKDGRLSSVLDWECAEFGDPAADLAYLRPHIEARMSWKAFMDRYEQVRGTSIDDERIRFFANFFHLRTLICCNIVATRIEQGLSNDIVALNIDYEYLPKMMKICVDATLS